MRTLEGHLSASGLKMGIVVSRWNDFITRALLDGALDALRRHGADDSAITVAWVPGSFEIPIALQTMARTGTYDALIALGCVIRGATDHYDHVASSVTGGVSRVALDHNIPVGFGVLTVDTIEQGIERAGSKAGNKGAEAALAAVEMAHLLRHVKG
ncbi:MAG: 6,7-dimethyl-8-ribityllumazine synthase [Chloroherpetonaceae bacterium]|nr:6,7-dimethyl-8-ribityllumazine synthase [Chthonomonadaceae bacterium]MDW8207089.1 6,7-dimethyl-8-ribityllumazine synthase [Chloroherpetonaceae bacterium]